MKAEFRKIFNPSNTLNRLIIINVAVFAIYKIFSVFFFLFGIHFNVINDIIRWCSLPADLGQLIVQPWSIISYMFLHIGFFHILFNMLWLYWMGKILMEYLGERKLAITYLLGGISGAILFCLSYNIFPVFKEILPQAYAMGASAGILAVVVATATLLPEYRIGLLFFGEVPLKYIAIASVAIDFLSISESNAGGHIAHIGGALYGFIYVKLLRKGYDMSRGISNFSDFVKESFSNPRLKVVHKSTFNKKRAIPDDEYIAQKKNKQELMDSILDKISQSGYESLSKAEKEFLFKISKDEK